jgi:hypothetical protein
MLVWFFAATAAAQSVPASVSIVRAECAEPLVDGARLLDHLRIELGADGVETVQEGAASGSLAILRVGGCDPTALVATVEDPLTQKTVQRPISLAAVPERARARTLALLLAELLRASWAELMLVPEPEVPVPVTVRAALDRRVERAARALGTPVADSPRIAIAIAPELRLLTDPLGFAWGARTDVAIALGDLPIDAEAGAGFRYAGAYVELGTLDLYEVALRAGLGVELTEPVVLFAGAWIDAGLAVVDASSNAALVMSEDALRFSLAIGTTAGLRVPFVDRFGMLAALDLAVALVGPRARAAGTSELGLTGFSAALRLGLFVDLR